MTCSKWSHYTADYVSFWDNTAMGSVTHSICRCSLELFCVLYIHRYGKRRVLGMRLLQGVGTEGGCDCVEASAKFISKECKNSFSITYYFANNTCSFA